MPMMTFNTISRSALLVASFALIASSPVVAQSKAATSKTVFQNEKVTIIDSVTKPGEGLPSAARGGLILYYLSGGTIERTYADGKKETITRKTGQALVNSEMRPYATLNTGSTTVHVIAIQVK
jgi:hypothetical protein